MSKLVKYSFTVLIERDEDGVFIAKVPALKGCHTQAMSLEELYSRIKEAIELCLDVEESSKEEISQNTFVGVHQLEICV